MFNKFLIITILLVSSFTMFSQNSVNNYKYVIVPDKYDFLDEEDQFRLNSLSQFLFNKHGFNAFMEDETFPEDLLYNPCLALKADVIDDSGSFKTKLKIELKNCKDELVFVSEMGESFEKIYEVAYNKALRDAFTYVAAIKYQYEPSEEILAESRDTRDEANQEIEQLKEEIAALKQEKETTKVVETPVAETTIAATIESVATKIDNELIESIENEETVLYAQKTDNGYQLVDSSPKVVMVLLKTKNPEVYMVQGKNAMVIKEDGFWYLSENDGSQVIDTRLNIKF
ncbi:hypothetical protein [Formosa maritima]|uniref:Secreted protein n=1 Tax=Formosa maritima TaxID=2592046 RepID=A0A5D0G5Y9_9FLAO|nr:hypothetical protein [Formosa maritima]TYA53267.1 hypothetical protein FVF61_11515 [Formosa maritima]